MTADEAMNDAHRARLDRAVNAEQWLTEFFATRAEAPSNEVIGLAKQAGISRSALWEAKEKLPIRAAQQFAPGGVHYWVWVWTGSREQGGAPIIETV